MTIPATNDSWLSRFHPSPAAPVRLVCFPHAGGSASFFFPVSRALAPAVEVLAVQYPGRQDRRLERRIEEISALADAIVPTLRGYDDRPLAFFGHSMGAVIAYEVALRLEAEGAGPVRLFASGRRAPSRYRDENTYRQSDAVFIEELRRLDGTDGRVFGDPELLKLIMPAIRSDYKAIETYRHEPDRRLSCPITALVGTADPKASVDEAHDWAKHTSGPFTMHTFPGGHFYLVPQAARVISLITDELRVRA